MSGLEQRMQFVLLHIGDAGLVQEGDELVFGDGFHGIFWLLGTGIADWRCLIPGR
jgi:hypothetical protein